MGPRDKNKLRRMEEALDVLLGETKSSDSSEEVVYEEVNPVKKLASQQINQLDNKPSSETDGESESQLAGGLASNEANKLSNELVNRQTISLANELDSKQDKKIIRKLDSELENLQANSLNKNIAGQIDEEITGELANQLDNEIDSGIDSEIINQQEKKKDRKPTSQPVSNLASKPVKKLTVLPDKKQVSRQSDPFLAALAAQLQSYLKKPQPADKVAVGSRLPRKLWELVELYCTYNKKQMQEFLEEAVVDKLKKELEID